ncbi:unnamed protein product [Strongylus vulgaris]|uniref:Uncharacterized protein n=1 Tax=Strongylus vulgaris TaxID=40348 RepID=A0A3P7IBV3_STRVU|nr:unnamed protein product [Strongylus vulgaris]
MPTMGKLPDPSATAACRSDERATLRPLRGHVTLLSARLKKEGLSAAEHHTESSVCGVNHPIGGRRRHQFLVCIHLRDALISWIRGRQRPAESYTYVHKGVPFQVSAILANAAHYRVM